MGVADGGTNVPAGGAGGAAGAAMEGAPGPVSAVTARERTLPVELSVRRGVLSGVPIEGAIGRSAGARSVPAGLDLGFAEAAAAGGAGRVVIADGACAFLAGAGGNSASSDRVVAAASGWVAVGRGGLGSSAFLRAPSVLRALAAAALFGSNRGGSVGFLT